MLRSLISMAIASQLIVANSYSQQAPAPTTPQTPVLSPSAPQSQGNPTLVGGGLDVTAQSNTKFDASNPILSPTIAKFATDPFPERDFLYCEWFGANRKNLQVGGRANEIGKTAKDIVQSLFDGSGAFGACSSTLPAKQEKTDCSFFTSTSSDNEQTFKKNDFKLALESMEKGKRATECQVAKIDTATDLMTCFNENYKKLENDFESVKEDFIQNRNQMKKYVESVRSEQTRQKQKSKTLTDKGKTVKDVFNRLESLRRKVNAAGDAGSNKIATSVFSLKSRVNEQISIAQIVEKEKAAMVPNGIRACFNRGSAQSGLRDCKARDGSILSHQDCIVNRFFIESKAAELGGGVFKGENSSEYNQAKFAGASLPGRLQNMLSEFSGINPRAKTVSELRATFAGELTSKYGKQVSDIFFSELTLCENEGKDKLRRDLTNIGPAESSKVDPRDPSIPIGSRVFALNQTTAQIASEGKVIIDEMTSDILNTASLFPGVNLTPLVSGEGCGTSSVVANDGITTDQARSLRSQVQCVERLNRSLTSIIDGKKPNELQAALEIPLDVTDERGQAIRCSNNSGNSGGSGSMVNCLAKIESEKFKAEQKIENMEDGEFDDPACAGGKCPGIKKFATKANLEVEKAFKNAAAAFNRRVVSAKQQLARVKALFRDAKVKAPKEKKITKKDFTCKEKDEDGLCQIPDPFGETLKNVANAPDIDPDEFTSVEDAARAEREKMDKERQEYERLAKALKGMESECKVTIKKANEKVVEGKEITALGKLKNRMKSAFVRCEGAARKGEKNQSFDDAFNKIARMSSEIQSFCERLTAATVIEDCGAALDELYAGQANCDGVLTENMTKVDKARDDKENDRLAKESARKANDINERRLKLDEDKAAAAAYTPDQLRQLKNETFNADIREQKSRGRVQRTASGTSGGGVTRGTAGAPAPSERSPNEGPPATNP